MTDNICEQFEGAQSQEEIDQFFKDHALLCPICKQNKSDQGAFIGPICSPCWNKKQKEIQNRIEKQCDTCGHDCICKNIKGECLSWRKKL